MFNLGLLIKTLSIQTKSNQDSSMVTFIENFLSKNKIKFKKDGYGNIYVKKGKSKSYPCIVSHIDTVHSLIGDNNFKIFKLDDILYAMNSLLGSQTGIGGDDKVGVYITLQLIKDLDNIKAVFYRNEEIGCLGSKHSIQNKKSFYNNCNFILQCDRKYKSDLITTSGGIKMCSTDFTNALQPYMKKYDFKEETGISTDVDKLVKEGVGISCVNISSGYYRPHTDTEVVKISEVNNTFDFVKDVIENLGTTRFEYEYTPPKYTYSYTTYKSDSTTYPKSTNIYFSKPVPKYIYKNVKLSTYSDFNVLNYGEEVSHGVYEYSLREEETLIPVKNHKCNICNSKGTIVYYPKEDIFMCKKCSRIKDALVSDEKEISSLYHKLKITSNSEDFVFDNLGHCWIKKDDSEWDNALKSYRLLDYEDRYRLAY